MSRGPCAASSLIINTKHSRTSAKRVRYLSEESPTWWTAEHTYTNVTRTMICHIVVRRALPSYYPTYHICHVMQRHINTRTCYIIWRARERSPLITCLIEIITSSRLNEYMLCFKHTPINSQHTSNTLNVTHQLHPTLHVNSTQRNEGFNTTVLT